MSVYLSASSIADFIRCSQKVYYRIYKPFPEIPSKEMLLGRVVHEAIEKGWQDRNVAYDIISKGARKFGFGKADLTNMGFYVDMFFLNFLPRLSDDDKIEYMFKVKLHDDVFIVGKMDRISNGNVYDWKTTSKLSKNLGNDVQCMIYDFAYQSLFKEKPASICLGWLREGQLLPYVENTAYREEVFDRIIPRMIKTIKSNSYEKLGIFNHSCFKCQWRQGCLSTGVNDELVDSNFSTE